MYLLYHGLLLPKETHSLESLKFVQDFTFKDDDVVTVTYPKSGQCVLAGNRTCTRPWAGHNLLLNYQDTYCDKQDYYVFSLVCEWHFVIVTVHVDILRYFSHSCTTYTPNSGGLTLSEVQGQWGIRAHKVVMHLF